MSQSRVRAVYGPAVIKRLLNRRDVASKALVDHLVSGVHIQNLVLELFIASVTECVQLKALEQPLLRNDSTAMIVLEQEELCPILAQRTRPVYRMRSNTPSGLLVRTLRRTISRMSLSWLSGDRIPSEKLVQYRCSKIEISYRSLLSSRCPVQNPVHWPCV